MPRYLNTARHPVDLGAGAFLAPQAIADLTVTRDTPDHVRATVDEHIDAGRLVEQKPKTRTRKSTSSEEES